MPLFQSNLIVSVYNLIFNIGCIEQMACKISENLIIISSEPVRAGSNTPLARVKNQLNI